MPPQPFKIPEVANLVWDKVSCKVTFDDDGIHLDPEPKRAILTPTLEWLLKEVSTTGGISTELEELLVEASQRAEVENQLSNLLAGNIPAKDLAKPLADLAERARVATKKPAKVKPAKVKPAKEDAAIEKASVVSAKFDTNISKFVFRGHKISISQRRVTEFRFWTPQDNNWAFETPGFWAEGHEFVGAFDTPQVIDLRKAVLVRFYPSGTVSSFKYNLKMSTTAWEKNDDGLDVDVGHVIIIIDPIMETGEVTV